MEREAHGLARRLAEIRSRVSLGTRAFAQALRERTGYEVSHTSVAQYESGTSVPAVYVRAVSETFDVALDWLLTGRGLPSRSPPGNASAALRKIVELVEDFRPASSLLQAQLDAFFRLSPQPFLILTSSGRILRWNRAFEDLLGYPEDELEDARLVRWIHEDDRATARADLERAVKTDEAAQCELRLRTATEGYRQLRCHVSEHRGQIFAVLDDVTGRRKAARELAEAKARFAAVFESAREGILLVDDRARYVDVNPAAERITGYSKEEFLQMTVHDLTVERDRDGSKEAWEEFVRKGQKDGSYCLLRKDGGEVVVEYRAVANIRPGLHLSVLRPRTP